MDYASGILQAAITRGRAKTDFLKDKFMWEIIETDELDESVARETGMTDNEKF